MADWANETEAGFDRVHGMRIKWQVVSILANKGAMVIIHDTFFEMAQTRLANVINILATIAMMPVSESYITANRGESPNGDPMGIDAAKAPFIWVEQSLMYSSSADDETVADVVVDTTPRSTRNWSCLV
jgi:hypothetical protein